MKYPSPLFRFAALEDFVVVVFNPLKCIHLKRTRNDLQYLKEPWYAIFNQWDELSFHSEDISEDESTADLVVS